MEEVSSIYVPEAKPDLVKKLRLKSITETDIANGNVPKESIVVDFYPKLAKRLKIGVARPEAENVQKVIIEKVIKSEIAKEQGDMAEQELKAEERVVAAEKRAEEAEKKADDAEEKKADTSKVELEAAGNTGTINKKKSGGKKK